MYNGSWIDGTTLGYNLVYYRQTTWNSECCGWLEEITLDKGIFSIKNLYMQWCLTSNSSEINK